jgi:prevent-host-death family protein
MAKEVDEMEHRVNMLEAKTQLSRLVALAQRGETVTIYSHGKPVDKLVPIKPRPVFGLMKDKWPALPITAFAPMSDIEAAEWGS